MAKLSLETAQTIWDLQHQLLEIIDTARTLELSLFEAFGETERTIPYLDELQSIAQQATERFSRFSTLQIRVANTQPPIPPDLLEVVNLAIQSTQQKIPALERSNQETIQEFDLS
jgi:predicted metalloprotease with PDZ domain